ncbi:MAG TPA: hypothetical protein VK900_09805 [Anaerolineales bacterium]|nr:hypothetical protein [Anaerolineales bacterium]
MSFDKAPPSDRLQTVTAVLFMGLFAAILLIITLPPGTIPNFLCNSAGARDALPRMCSSVPASGPEGSGQLITSTITSACLDGGGLNISVTFSEPLTGASTLQVFTTGDDYFPSEQGISDSFRMNMRLAGDADHADFIIPVDLMPVGEQIFGNFVITDDDVYSFVAYSVYVSDCSAPGIVPADPSPNDIPVIRSATCLPSRHLMIAFEFQGPVLGQYRASVDDIPYELASVINQPATLYFSGDSPPEGPVIVRLLSATDEVTVFEETFTPPVCAGT